MGGINNDKAMKSILEGVDYMIKKAIKDAPSDKIYVATVLEAKNNNLYKIQLKDKVYDNIPSLFQDIIQNEPVRVVVPQNNYNQMFILGKHNMDSIGDYNNLRNKPQINGVELKGNKTAKDLGLISEAMLADLFKDREYKAGEYTIYQGEMYKAKKNTKTTQRFFKPEYEINKSKENIILDDNYITMGHNIYWSGNTDKSGCICWYSPSYQNYPPQYVGGYGADNIIFAMVSPYEDCTYYRRADKQQELGGKLLPTRYQGMQYAKEYSVSEFEYDIRYGAKLEAEDGTSWWLKILDIQGGASDAPHIFSLEEENKRFVEGLSQVFKPFDHDEKLFYTPQVLQIILDQTLDEQQVNVPPYDTNYWEKIPSIMSQIVPLAREYNDFDNYTKGDYVMYDGCLYKLIEDTNDRDGAKQPPTNSDYWQKIDYVVDEVINYINLRNKPKINGHELIGDKSTADLEILPPIASKTQFGGVIVGDGIDVDETGKISIDGDFLPTPTLDGNVMVVENEEWVQKPLEDAETDPTVPQYVKDITEEDIERWNQGGTTLPIASTTQLGGVKIGSGITITEDGTISAQGGGGSGLPVPTANDNILVSKGTDWEQKNISTSTIPSFTKAEYALLKDTIPTGTRFIITDDNESQTAIRSDGLEIYSADWITASSNGLGYNLTNAITLSEGKYLVICQHPMTSNDGVYWSQVYINDIIPTNNPLILAGGSCYNAIFMIDVAEDDTVIQLKSAQSSFMSFSYLEKGYMKAIKLDTLFDASAPSDIYSTDEKPIGQWINKKPLYQKTYILNNMSSSTSDWTTLLEVENADNIISINGFVIGASNQQKIQVNSIYISTMTLNNVIKYYAKDVESWGFLDFTITIQYTKGSD